MNRNLLIVGGAGVLAWVLYRQRRADRRALEAQALGVLAGKTSPNIAIANVEAIEERRVLVFAPASGSIQSPALNFGQETDFRDLWRLGVPANPVGGRADTRWPLLAAAVVRLDGKGGRVPLVTGAFYSADPAMGDLPFGSYRVEVQWEAPVYSGGPKPEATMRRFNAVFEVDAAVWQRCFTARIATVAEQVQAGGVVEVPAEFLK